MASGSQSGNAAEIDRLALALAKDPGSKAFIPLAEEYGKAGMWAEAAGVLEDGLKYYPGFITAMVALGRAYDQMGQPAKAKAILEEAVKISPENLRAHRTLAKIYVAEGAKEAALRSCNVILAANPSDQESLSLRASLGIQASATPTKSVKSTAPRATPVSHEAQPHPEPEAAIVEGASSAPVSSSESARPDGETGTAAGASISIESESFVASRAEPATGTISQHLDDIEPAHQSAMNQSSTRASVRHQATIEKLEQWLRAIQTRRRDRPTAETAVPTSHV